LDLDGVLNSQAYMLEQSMEPKALRHPTGSIKDAAGWVKMIDKRAVVRLNKIIAETRAKVVISSSWRHAHTPERMQTLLMLAGFVGEVIDQTPIMNGPRGHEIASWLGSHPKTKHFVILDDSSDAGEGGLTKWFIRTDIRHGRQDEHVTRAINLLGRH